MDFLGKNVGVGCHFLLRGIFHTQGSKPRLLHWQVGSFPLSDGGSPSCFYQSMYLVARDTNQPVPSGKNEELDILATSVKFPPDYSECGD